MKKRVREEAQSITANCNIKIFGKLEDPTETKEFFEKTVGTAIVTEVSGFQMAGGTELGSYFDTQQAGVQMRPRANYDDLRGFKEGQAVITFGEVVVDCAVFYSNPGFAKAMRVTRFLALPPPDEELMKHANAITKLRDLMVNKSWTAERSDVAVATPPEIDAMNEGFEKIKKEIDPVDRGIMAMVQVHAINNKIEAPPKKAAATGGAAPASTPPAQEPKKPAASPIPTGNIQKPAATTAPPTAPPAQEQKPAATGGTGDQAQGNPMGFFGSGDKTATPPPTAPPPATPPAQATTPPAAPPPQEQKPVTPPPAAATPPPAQPTRATSCSSAATTACRTARLRKKHLRRNLYYQKKFRILSTKPQRRMPRNCSPARTARILMRPNNSRISERGNVFIFILLGLVLFAALSFTVARGFRSDTTSQMTDRQAELLATEIITYGQQMERTVNRLRRNGLL